MSHRWHPPGTGWITTWDTGNLAVWMAPARHAGVAIALYAADYFGDGAEVWVVTVPRGSWIPAEVMDKPHRITWVQKDPDDLLTGGQVLLHQQVAPSHRGHRRLAYRRKLYCNPLPRPIRAALAVDGQEAWSGWFAPTSHYQRAWDTQRRRIERRTDRRRRIATRRGTDRG